MNKSYLNSRRHIALSLRPSKAIQLLLMVLFVLLMPLVSFGQSSQTFNASGTFAVPAGVTSITVQAWGGGGAGGGSTSAGATARAGAGGGGGAYATATFTVTSGANLPVIVGAGGTGVSGSTGNVGSFSTITGYTTTIYAAGGSGGVGNTSGGSPAGGAGGTVAASAGTTRTAGNTGGNGETAWGADSGAGGAGANSGGAGGASVGGFGSTSNGESGNQPGGGGSGARTSTNGGSRTGGAGGAGRVIVSWCPVYSLTSTAAVATACTTTKTSIVTLTSTAAGLPVGTYTVTYSLSYNGNSTSYTAPMTVTTAGTGQFTASLAIMGANNSTTIRVNNLASGTCNNAITSNNVSNTINQYQPITPTTFSGYSSSCTAWVAQWQNDTFVSGYYLDVATTATFTAGTYVAGFQNLNVGNVQAYTISGLASGTYYYRVRNNNLGCGVSVDSNVTSFTVGTVAPTGSASQSFCSGATVANLVATGSTIKWYAAASGGTALATSTALVNGTHYYASQTTGCGESTARLDVTATVTPSLSAVAVTPSTAQTFCPSGTGNLLTATPTGGGVITGYQWGVRSAPAGAITTIATQTASTYTPSFADLGVGTWYIVCTVTPTCGSAITSSNVIVTITGLTVTPVSICAGDASIALASSASCADSTPVTLGANNAGSNATQSGGGTGDSWSNRNRIVSNNDSYVNSDIDNSSRELYTSDYGFSVPSNATIAGVQVTIGRYAQNSNSLHDNKVNLRYSGSEIATNKASSSYWPTSEAAATYGSSSDVWGATLTPAIINDDTFGVVLDVDNDNSNNREAYVDYIQISVTYTFPGTLDWYTVSSGGTKLGSGTSFNPVGVAGSGLVNTNTPGTTTYYVECSSNSGCRMPVNYVINAAAPSAPIVGTITQPNCITSTGSVVLSGLPASGTWTLTRTPGGITTTGTGVSTTISGLAGGTYTYTVATGICQSSASANVTITSTATKTWNGTAWSPAGTPTSSNAVIIDGNYNTSSNGDLNACSLIINSGYKLTITAGGFVIIQNDLTVNTTATLDVLDKGSLVMVNDAGVVTNNGTTNVRRFTTLFKQYDYTYWSTPVVSTTIATTFPTWNTNYAYEYLPANFYDGNGDNIDDNEDDWSFANTMTPAKGYIIMVPTPTTGPGTNNPSEVVFRGRVNNGVQKVTGVIPDATYLVGNPYPSALDADAFINANAGVIDGTLYFWTHNTAIQLASGIGAGKAGSGPYAFTSDDYASYNGVGGVATASAISGGVIPSGKIASTQGFFTTTNATIVGTNEIVFNNAMRLGSGGVTVNNTQFFKTRKQKESIEKSRIWLNLSNEKGAFKQTLVGYVSGATNNNEGRFDGETFDGNEFIDFYSVNEDKNLVIQGRALPFDDNDEVPLGYRSAIEGTFNINIEQVDGLLMNQDVFIQDKLTNTEFDLKSGNYTFNTTKGTFNDRFVLKYKSAKTLGTGNFDVKANQVLVSVKNKQITINSFAETIDNVVIYDVLGRQIFKKDKVNSNELSIADFVVANQALIVKTTLQNGAISTDKIVY